MPGALGAVRHQPRQKLFLVDRQLMVSSGCLAPEVKPFQKCRHMRGLDRKPAHDDAGRARVFVRLIPHACVHVSKSPLCIDPSVAYALAAK